MFPAPLRLVAAAPMEEEEEEEEEGPNGVRRRGTRTAAAR